MFKRTAVLAYGIFCYVVFFATFLYSIAFIGNFGVTRAIDYPANDEFGLSLLTNVGLLTIFALQHSVMARPAFKRLWTRIIPGAAERSTYVLASSAALILLFRFWQPLGGSVWSFDGAAAVALYAIFALGWILLLASTFYIDHFDLFGLRQVWLYFTQRPYQDIGFRTPGPYRVVRHPIYVGWLMIFWATPTMGATHLLFAVITTIYILVAIQFEERDLVDHLGDDYQRYIESVPMLVPFTGRKPARTYHAKSISQ